MAKRKRKYLVVCPYCRGEFRHCDTQRDHVPPKGLFRKPWPADLITVRCCAGCHGSLSDGDEVLKAVAAMGVVRMDSVVGIRGEIDRALDRNPWWRKELVRQAGEARRVRLEVGDLGVEVHRLQFGGKMGEALDETVKRICKGLLFDQDPEFDTSGLVFQVKQVGEDQTDSVKGVLKRMQPIPFHKQLGGDAFLAGWRLTDDGVGAGVMVIQIYGGLIFLVFFSPAGFGK